MQIFNCLSENQDFGKNELSASQMIEKGSVGIFFDALNHPAKFGIGIQLLNICDGDRDARITFDMLVFFSIGGMGELDIFAIPQKPHRRRLRLSAGTQGSEMGKCL